MKYRKDFVTNSSSSSFVIAKKYLDEGQLEAIRKNKELGVKLGLPLADSYPYKIRENSKYIEGYTSMDNYNIDELFRIIGVDREEVRWDEFLPIDLDWNKDDYDEDGEDAIDWRSMLKDL